MTARERRALCPICAGPSAVGRWCGRCRRSYDRRIERDDGTLLSALEWAAQRARDYARAVQAGKKRAGPAK